MSELGKYDVYTVVGSIYCYKGTNVLRNKLDIRDGDELRRLDADISLLKQKSLLSKPIMGRFTSNHLCRIHKYMFEDVYPFAGHFRILLPVQERIHRRCNQIEYGSQQRARRIKRRACFLITIGCRLCFYFMADMRLPLNTSTGTCQSKV